MSKSQTPETDAVSDYWLDPEMSGEREIVKADFARKLEIERDELRDTIRDVLAALEALTHEGPRMAAVRVKGELDELLSRLTAIELRMPEELSRLEQERNEARAQLQAERELADDLGEILTWSNARYAQNAITKWKEAR